MSSLSTLSFELTCSRYARIGNERDKHNNNCCGDKFLNNPDTEEPGNLKPCRENLLVVNILSEDISSDFKKQSTTLMRPLTKVRSHMFTT
jgi:hypothetical protein